LHALQEIFGACPLLRDAANRRHLRHLCDLFRVIR
jgi:hypothetical protein